MYIKQTIFSYFDCDPKQFLNTFFTTERCLVPASEVSKNNLDVMLKRIFELLKNGTQTADICAIAVTVELLYLLNELDVRNEPAESVFTDPLIGEIIKYLDINSQNNIKLDELANSYYVSKFYLSRKFKETVGIGVGEYVTLRRLFAANQYLNQGYGVEEAAYKAGFKNYSYFSDCTKIYGFCSFKLQKEYLSISN